jgi:hypothetical protein
VLEDQRPLLRAILAAFLALEDGSNDDIDPDWAVKAMENISWEVVQLGDADQAALRADFLALAHEYDEPWRSFVSAFPDSINLKGGS